MELADAIGQAADRLLRAAEVQSQSIAELRSICDIYIKQYGEW